MLLIFLAFAGTAHGQGLTLGLSGALYMSDEEMDDPTFDVGEHFANGEGVYYGFSVELLLQKFGLGMYTYFSFYELYDGWDYEMMDADVNLAISYHLLGTSAVLDPFVELGAGSITRNITAYDEGLGGGWVELDEPFPFLGTTYWHYGIGLGVNLGGLGGFIKIQDHHATGPLEVDGSATYGGYTTDDFPLKRYKVIIGAKLWL